MENGDKVGANGRASNGDDAGEHSGYANAFVSLRGGFVLQVVDELLEKKLVGITVKCRL